MLKRKQLLHTPQYFIHERRVCFYVNDNDKIFEDVHDKHKEKANDCVMLLSFTVMPSSLILGILVFSFNVLHFLFNSVELEQHHFLV